MNEEAISPFCLKNKCYRERVLVPPHGASPKGGKRAHAQISNNPKEVSPTMRYRSSSADPERANVLVVSHDEELIRTVKGVVSDCRQFRLFGYFRTALETSNLPHGADLRLLVVEVALPDGCGVDLARTLLVHHPRLRHIFVSSLHHQALIGCAATLAHSHYLVKPVKPAQCLATMQMLSCPDYNTGVRSANGAAQALTTREAEVLRCLAQGMFYKEITDHLGITHSILRKLQHSAYSKLGAHSKVEAINHWGHWPAGKHV
jgi:two-component system response regulator DesR